MKRIIFIFMTLFAFNSFAQAANSDGNFWQELCNGKTDFGTTVCRAFTSGFISGMGVQAEYFKSEKLFCFPATAKNSQAADVFSKYLDRHPESRHLDSTTLAAIAMIEAFPCK
jgi:hypothetical protein